MAQELTGSQTAPKTAICSNRQTGDMPESPFQLLINLLICKLSNKTKDTFALNIFSSCVGILLHVNRAKVVGSICDSL